MEVGAEYDIMVQAKNENSWSSPSSTIRILAAILPSPPVNLANDADITTASQIGLTWEQPLDNGGAEIT